MQIVFVYDKPLSSALTKFFTGSRCYHVGFTDGVRFWDMNKIRRRRLWKDLYPSERIVLHPCPVEITAEYLDYKLDTDESEYGYLDYLMFLFRWPASALGLRVMNAWGLICSEMLYEDFRANGWSVTYEETPSPADLELSIMGRKNALHNKG